MENQLNSPDNAPQHKYQDKGNDYKNQLKTIFKYLENNVATASMVSDETGIPQKNICRYKRDLEKAGRLWELVKKQCKKTGFKAWYLTTNPDYANSENQLKLF
jgi:hypothetical protein